MNLTDGLRRIRRRHRIHKTRRPKPFNRRIVLEWLEQRTVLSANVMVVNSTAYIDSDPTTLTLREAILAANATTNLTEPDRVQFGIPVNDPGHVYYQNDGVATQVSPTKITATTAATDSQLADPDPDWPYSWFSIQFGSGQSLPSITEAVVIDGYTQPGAMFNTNSVESLLGLNTVLRIELDGSGVAAGLLTDSTTPGTVIRGLAIGRFGPGITLSNGANSTIEGNFIGTDVSGTLARGNFGGISVGYTFFGSGGHLIGGSTPAARNLISGNTADGMRIVTTGNRVEGNLVGTDRTGTRALRNHGDAVELSNDNNKLGGVGFGTRNILSGNGAEGVFITGSNNLVQGNFIGTDITGKFAVPNTIHGVRLIASNNTIGGIDADDGATDGVVAARNVIAANWQGGVSIEWSASGTVNNRVQGNFIGTDVTGTAALGNGFNASGGRYGGITVYLASNSLIGGTEAGAANVIANNAGDGVLIRSGTGHAILGNRIYSNGELGIDLAEDGAVTPNDLGDADTGANNLQNFPVLTSVQAKPTGTTIAGTLNSTASTMFRIEFFASAAADTTGYGEGQTFLGAIDVNTNASGAAPFTITFPSSLPTGQVVTSTATVRRGTGAPGYDNTSEFSPAQAPVITPETDYGDAPNWFPTRLADDGARHGIAAGFFLGARIDGETDGQPDIAANLDDNTGGVDDEDGVVFGTLVAGGWADVTITATAAGLLNAWIDLDLDGGWSDPGEQIFIDRAIVAGQNQLRFPVPAVAAITPGTYARFRFSSLAGLTYSGLAPNGEVEDYLVPIIAGATVSGMKFNDLDGDHARDINEPGLAGWVIYVDLDNSGTRNAGEPAAVTQDGALLGLYKIYGVPAGTYKVREEPRTDWTQTFPEAGYYQLEFAEGTEIEGATFGNRPLMDFGDANGYPTLFSQTGAAHIVDPDLYLGARLDAEDDGQLGGAGTGDDASGDDDEDGIFFGQQLRAGQESLVIAIASTAGRLDAWIDFNDDSDWDDPGEQVFNSQLLAEGVNSLTVQVPAWVTPAQTFARFRLSRAGGLSPRGSAPDGEVEDYSVTLLRQEDFGDAHGYPTLLANDGARHLIDPDLYLGFRVDEEADGQTEGLATGDDLNDRDDEDGVFFTRTLAGNTELVVIASAPGFLDAWIDYSSDRTWDDLPEKIFDSQPLIEGLNQLEFQIPEWVPTMGTYARFRFSSAGGLSYAGPAADGEVEDYFITILRNQDFGDAPSTYEATLRDEDGARHLVAPGFYLGAGVDYETDGPPSAAADADDLAGDDDENGVVFVAPMRPGVPLDVEVTASQAGFLDAWVDFNADGDWDDLREQVFARQPLSAGLNPLSIQVPIGAALSDVYARFRLSRQGGIPYFGAAPDGEVEDYAVPIDALGTLTGRVWDDRNGDGAQATDEPGLAGWGIFIDEDHDGVQDTSERVTATDAGGSFSFRGLVPGVYDLGLVGRSGWQQGYPLWIPRWIYVAEHVRRPRDLSNPGYFVHNRVEIYDQETLELLDTFYHSELDAGEIYDIEIGPGGDVYVAVDQAKGVGQIVQFTYDGEYVRTIYIPDDGEVFHIYPNGFDVLPSGRLLIPQPDHERLVIVDSDGSLVSTLDVPGFRPIDAAMLSDGTIVFTDNSADESHDGLLNVRSDDRFWVGTSEGAVLRNLVGDIVATRPVANGREALETPEGILFATAAILIPGGLFPTAEHRLLKYDADGNELDHATLVGPVVFEGDPLPIIPVDTVASAKGIAVAWSEVPYGNGPVRGGAGALGGNQLGFGAPPMQSEISVPTTSNPVPSGLGTWRLTVGAAQTVDGSNFGVFEFSSATGVVFADQDGNGLPNADEGLEGWLVWADLDDDGISDGGEPRAMTARDGRYTLVGIPPGSYKIRTDLQSAWAPTIPAGDYREIDFMSGTEFKNVDFSNRPARGDFGDAPAPYPTLWADDGAWHVIDSNVRLGDLIDAEFDGRPNEFALGDDRNPLGGADDEDGVSVPLLVAGATAEIEVAARGQGLLSAWIDWNKDGDWADPGEQAVVDEPMIPLLVNRVNVAVPQDAPAGPTFARFRFSTQAGLSFQGPAPDGEVEDYRVLVEKPVEIHGRKWNDRDGNGVWDDGEPVLPGATIFLDKNGNRQLDASETSTTTDENGAYAFTGLVPGVYTVVEVQQEFWTQTFPHHSIRRVSVDRGGNQADASSSYPVLEGGFSTVFQSLATNLVPPNGSGTYAVDQQGEVLWVTPSSADSAPSAYGGLIAAEFFGQIFVYDPLGADEPERVSVNNDGEWANGDSSHPSIGGGDWLVGGGRFVAFQSDATNLLGEDDWGNSLDSNGVTDIFVFDRRNQIIRRVSGDNFFIAFQANLPSFDPSISDDGEWVAFTSYATNLVPNDNNGNMDVYVVRNSGFDIERISVGRLNNQEIEGNGESQNASISADGRFVAFESATNDLVFDEDGFRVDTNDVKDIYVFDRQTRTMERVSVSYESDQFGRNDPDDHSFHPSISGDGRFVTFQSNATNLVPGDTNGVPDIFVYDRRSGATERVSMDGAGNQADDFSLHPSISSDGRRVAFASLAHNLVPGDTNEAADIFVYEKHVHSVLLASGQVAEGLDFGNIYYSGAVIGMKYEDIDGDHKHGQNEPGLDGWVIYADLNRNEVRDVGELFEEPFDTTHDGGLYRIEGIPPGTWTIREERQPGWRQTAPAAGYHEILFGSGSVFIDKDFGNQLGSSNSLVQQGDTLYILGDTGDDQIQVWLDPTGLLNVAYQDAFHVFTGIRRIVADMKSGRDMASFFGPASGMVSPVKVEYRADFGDDQIHFENWLGNIVYDKPHRWNNTLRSLDVTGDTQVVAADALAIINYLNAFGSGIVPTDAPYGPPYYDTSADDFIAPNDALEVINHINAFGPGGPGPTGEGESDSADEELLPAEYSASLDDLIALVAAEDALSIINHQLRAGQRRQPPSDQSIGVSYRKTSCCSSSQPISPSAPRTLTMFHGALVAGAPVTQTMPTSFMMRPGRIRGMSVELVTLLLAPRRWRS